MKKNFKNKSIKILITSLLCGLAFTCVNVSAMENSDSEEQQQPISKESNNNSTITEQNKNLNNLNKEMNNDNIKKEEHNEQYTKLIESEKALINSYCCKVRRNIIEYKFEKALEELNDIKKIVNFEQLGLNDTEYKNEVEELEKEIEYMKNKKQKPIKNENTDLNNLNEEMNNDNIKKEEQYKRNIELIDYFHKSRKYINEYKLEEALKLVNNVKEILNSKQLKISKNSLDIFKEETKKLEEKIKDKENEKDEKRNEVIKDLNNMIDRIRQIITSEWFENAFTEIDCMENFMKYNYNEKYLNEEDKINFNNEKKELAKLMRETRANKTKKLIEKINTNYEEALNNINEQNFIFARFNLDKMIYIKNSEASSLEPCMESIDEKIKEIENAIKRGEAIEKLKANYQKIENQINGNNFESAYIEIDNMISEVNNYKSILNKQDIKDFDDNINKLKEKIENRKKTIAVANLIISKYNEAKSLVGSNSISLINQKIGIIENEFKNNKQYFNNEEISAVESGIKELKDIVKNKEKEKENQMKKNN